MTPLPNKPTKKTTKQPRYKQVPLELEESVETPEIEDRLSSIYRDDKGSLPDFNQLDRTRSFWWMRLTVWGVIGACLISILAWAGFMAWRPWRTDVPAAVAIQIEGPTTISPGKAERILIHWQNQDVRPLREADIRVLLPPEFLISTADPSPTNATSSLWQLGLITPQQRGTIELVGVFYGASDHQANIQALASYRYTSIEKAHQLVRALQIPYTTSTVEGTLALPERIIPGDVVTLRYLVKNHSDQTLGPLEARMTLPEGFIATATTSTNVAQDGQQLTYQLATLPAGSQTTLQVTGSMLSGHPGDALVQASVGRRDGQGSFVTLARSETRSVVLAGDLTLQLVANGSSSGNPIESQAPLRVTLGYENTSGEPLKNVSFTLSIESTVNGKRRTGTDGLIDWKFFQDGQRAVSSTKGQVQTLKITASQIPALASLPIGAKGSFDWTLPVRHAATGTKDAIIQISAIGHADQVGSTSGTTRDVKAASLALPYKTDADLTVIGRYATEEGAPVGFGPIPPVMGKATGYRVIWRIDKTLHSLDRITVSAKLPKVVTWGKVVTADRGVVAYDAASGEVRWTIPVMPLDTSQISASFDIQVTPQKADVGRFAPLLQETTFNAHDIEVNSTISRTKPSLSTDLPDDVIAREHGVVKG